MYTIPSGRNLFRNLDFSLENGEKAALVGDNGSGKSTLLRLFAGALSPDSGSIRISDHYWYIPQHVSQLDNLTVAQVLQVQDKLEALFAIENGSVDPKHFEKLADDWLIHERLQQALDKWDLSPLTPQTPFKSLSGGQKTRVLLAGINLHQPQLILMDEPTNHLDTSGRNKLYRSIQNSDQHFLIVSHDRELLNFCNPVYELSSLGIKKYGGNYDFYEEQKQVEMEAIEHQIHHIKQSISEARKKHRETMQRKQKLDARASKKARQANLPKIIINAAKNSAENSTSRLKDVHEEKIIEEKQRLRELNQKKRSLKNIQISFDNSSLHTGKNLYQAKQINYAWADSHLLWDEPLSFLIQSGERIRINGSNGSGKSTLLHLLNEDIKPTRGKLLIQSDQRFLMDQKYTFIDRDKTVLQQAESANQIKKPDHELKTLLHRHLFDEKVWDQKCETLSGGETMRLTLCCLSLQTKQPDTILLDEPTNNLDLRNIKILTQAISDYQGTLIVVSHDSHFIKEIGIDRKVNLSELNIHNNNLN